MKFSFRILFLIGAIACINSSVVSAGPAKDSLRLKRQQACFNCNCQSIPAGLTATVPMLKNIWMFSYRYMDMNMMGNLRGTSDASDNSIFQSNYLMTPRNMNMQMHMLMAMRGLTPRLTVMGMVSYSFITMGTDALTLLGEQKMIAPDGSVMIMPAGKVHYTSSAEGIGDVKLYGIYSLLKSGHHSIIGTIGLSVPTANIHYISTGSDMYAGFRQSYMMRLGTGTWDVMPGLTYLFISTPASFGAQLNGIIRPGYNSLNFRFGNEANLNAWVSHRWSQWISNSFRVSVSDVGTIRGYDVQLPRVMEPAADPANYGGQRATANLGINISIPHGPLRNTTVEAEFGLPIYQNVNGIQTGLHSVFNAGVDYMF